MLALPSDADLTDQLTEDRLIALHSAASERFAAINPELRETMHFAQLRFVLSQLSSHQRSGTDAQPADTDLLPAHKFTESSTGLQQPVCVICHDEFQTGESVKRFPCQHLFHAACIDLWFHSCPDHQHGVCPDCRQHVRNAAQAPHSRQREITGREAHASSRHGDQIDQRQQHPRRPLPHGNGMSYSESQVPSSNPGSYDPPDQWRLWFERQENVRFH